MLKYFLAIKKNKVLMHSTTWMNPESTLLSERSQTQKTTILCNFIYIKCAQQEGVKKIHQQLPRAGVRRVWGMVGTGFLSGLMKISKTDYSDG